MAELETTPGSQLLKGVRVCELLPRTPRGADPQLTFDLARSARGPTCSRCSDGHKLNAFIVVPQVPRTCWFSSGLCALGHDAVDPGRITRHAGVDPWLLAVTADSRARCDYALDHAPAH